MDTKAAVIAGAVAVAAVAPVAAAVVEAQPAAAAGGCYAGRIVSDSRALYGGYNVSFIDMFSGRQCFFTTHSETCNPIYGRPYARVTDYTCYR